MTSPGSPKTLQRWATKKFHCITTGKSKYVAEQPARGVVAAAVVEEHVEAEADGDASC